MSSKICQIRIPARFWFFLHLKKNNKYEVFGNNTVTFWHNITVTFWHNNTVTFWHNIAYMVSLFVSRFI